ncbi:hypothetical protein Daus18300_005766 [Diaporthe australafricana]|uniref:Ribonuclease H1 N-terminal domain-containing protein n=1 Tax=Diaporthe australafricana TaxID=127596 RepID=A0ABR3WZ61_9PEZI
MAKRKAKKIEYFAVVKGRIDEPTIFSSWGDAHPRVTGCESIHKGFPTIEEARNYMFENRVPKPKEDLKEGAGETTPIPNSLYYYAVASGDKPGIYPYCGEQGSKQQVTEMSGSCHKRFRTQQQAEDFIKDWKETVASLYLAAIKNALDEGLRPKDMKFRVEDVFSLPSNDSDGSEETLRNKLGDLSIE